MASNENANTERPTERVTVDRPEAGETLTVPTAAGLRIVLAFDPDDAGFSVTGSDFIVSFEDGARIVFQGLVTAAQGAEAPTIQIDGIDIGAGLLMGQVLALTDRAEVDPIETAAGADGEGAEAADGGISHYDDSFGNVIDLLIMQGVIGETDLTFGLIDDGNIELPIDTAALSNRHANSGGGFGPLGAGSPTPAPAPSSFDEPSADPDSDSVSITVNRVDIITNESTGNLEIPDELLLYLATGDHGKDLRVTGPSNDDGNNASVWEVEAPWLDGSPPDSANTWANHVTDNVKFHIGNGNPFYHGSFTYQMTNGSDQTGTNTVGVKNYETGQVGGRWTLIGDNTVGEGETLGDEVLLGLDGRNWIDGGIGNDVIHGGHDSSGDVLIGGDGNDVIFGGGGNDDLRGGNGDDTFIMRAGFGRDDVDGGADSDTIRLDSVLTGADIVNEDAIDTWLDADRGFAFDANTITFTESASGTIDLGGGNVITFLNIEQIDYAVLA